MRTQTQGPHSVRNKMSWLYSIAILVLEERSLPLLRSLGGVMGNMRALDPLSSLVTTFNTRGGTWVFFGWVCAARDSKLAPRSKKTFP